MQYGMSYCTLYFTWNIVYQMEYCKDKDKDKIYLHETNIHTCK